MLINAKIIAEGLLRRAAMLREEAAFMTAKHEPTGSVIPMPEAVQKQRAAEDLEALAGEFGGTGHDPATA